LNSTEKRKNQRTAHLKPTQIMLKNHSYQIKDISNNGVGIILDKDNPQFFIGERIEDIPISLSTGIINVRGVVSHISVTLTQKICGVMFLLTGEEFKSVIQFKNERSGIRLTC
jgi:hypothetical protein